jgi:hypothetical protein
MHLANSNRPTWNIMRKFSAVTIMVILASARLVNSASVPQRGSRKKPSVCRRTDMGGGTEINGAAVGVLVDAGCPTAISRFTVGSNRAVSALMSTVADEASPAVGSSSALNCERRIDAYDRQIEFYP